MRLKAPPLPLWLGLSGLLPFWLLALGRVTGVGFGVPASTLSSALACYAATILSFLGGVRWGLALSRPDQRSAMRHYGASVVPQLAGWSALALPDPWRLLLLAVLLLVLGPLDRGLARQGWTPPWFGDLRIALSVGAGAALFLGALG